MNTDSLFNFMLAGARAQQAVNDITSNYHRQNPQSVAANQKAAPGKEKARKRICEALRSSNGLSCEQLEDLTGLSHQSCSARVSELKRDRKITKIGVRTTRSGANAAVYIDNGR